MLQSDENKDKPDGKRMQLPKDADKTIKELDEQPSAKLTPTVRKDFVFLYQNINIY